MGCLSVGNSSMVRLDWSAFYTLIFYYPVTPQEYEPPGFKPSTCTDFQYEEEPVTINVGDVASDFFQNDRDDVTTILPLWIPLCARMGRNK